jgi:hypothetical protein
MQVNMRREARWIERQIYSLCWQPNGGPMESFEVRGIDLSKSGIRVAAPRALPIETVVFIQAQSGKLSGYASVRHSTPHGGGMALGLAFNEETKATVSFQRDAELDYYAFLQVNPKADWQTIHRIYRMMASRFHPDNPETGDPEKFLILQAAYETLSDRQRRAAYDASLLSRDTGTLPIFELSEFVNGIEGEMNRRLGVLSLLYNRRRTSPHSPGISILDLEKRMGMPREYLEFTVWYLKSKQYVIFGDNSELVLTVLGVDFVESNCSSNSIIQKLIDSGPRFATSSSSPDDGEPEGAKTRRLLAEAGEHSG